MIPRISTLLVAAAAGLRLAQAIPLDIDSPESIRDVSATLAYNLMTFYTNNQSTTPPENVGTLNPPLYWWEAGAVWGGLVDYWAYTNDTSYNPTVTEALLAQTGPDDNYMPPAYFSSLGNDDQAFWALACLSAAEYDFPVPTDRPATFWLDLAIAVFNTQIARWDTETCAGGLRWQVFESNDGWTYKNSISNGGLFQISARLARYTGNATYTEWATRSWDWMSAIGLIDANYNVYDGTDLNINCTELNHMLWSYNPSMLLLGTAALSNATAASPTSPWHARTTGLFLSAANTFFTPDDNATNIMFERSCEPVNTCNNDQFSFKAYLSRFMSKAAILAPYLHPATEELLTRSATAAAESCSGPASQCGQKWYVGGFDGSVGEGQALSALETVQSLLLLQGGAARVAPGVQEGVSIETRSDAGQGDEEVDLEATGTIGEANGGQADAGPTDEVQGGSNGGDGESKGPRLGASGWVWPVVALPVVVHSSG